jgi:hypothetical protein
VLAPEDLPSALDPSHLPLIERLLTEHPRTPSEYQLANLYLFRAAHRYTVHNAPLPCVTGTTYDGVRHALPLGPLDAAALPAIAAIAACIYPLAEGEARQLAAASALALSYNSDDSDYLYDAVRLSTLAGAKTKAQQARAFEAAASPRLAPLEAIGPEAAYGILDLWLRQSGRAPKATDSAACREAIACAPELGLQGMAVIAEGRPSGFLLAGPARNGVRVVHFAKGRRDQAGLYPWMFARFAAVCGAKILNFEQDLGSPGLAQAKRALAPASVLHKYRLQLRPTTVEDRP